MKDTIVNILKNHVKNNKLDEFGTLFCTFYLISITKYYTNELEKAFKELGVIKEEK